MTTNAFLYRYFGPSGIVSGDIEDTYLDDGVTKGRVWSLVRGRGACILDGIVVSTLNQTEIDFIVASNAYTRTFLAQVETIEQARRDIVDQSLTQIERDTAQAILDDPGQATARVLALETLRAGEPDQFDGNGDQTAEWTTWNSYRELNDYISYIQLMTRMYVEIKAHISTWADGPAKTQALADIAALGGNIIDVAEHVKQ